MGCPSCGHRNRAGARFCSQCAAPLPGVCPRCGAGLRQAARFCYACGQVLSVPLSRPPQSRAPLVPAAFAGGRYEVKRFLGEGGRKRVYLAHDTRLDRDVAFALIKTEDLDEAGLARIRREAQAMGRLGDHPHIVTLHDIGEENGQPYIVSQYLAGGDVEELLQRAEGRRLPLEQALRIADQVCGALEHAHAHGIIHRDLKPGNVWLTADGTAQLGDFGLAVAPHRSRLTQAGVMVGTVDYVPPEQALGGAPDARSDLYSLGVMLYEMLTGRPPFLGDDALAVIFQHIHTAPVAPSWHNPDVPPALEALILGLLAKAPEDRPASAAAVREALAAIGRGPPRSSERQARAEARAAANPLDRLAGGVFVGRGPELEGLRGALEDALSGRGRLVLLTGEPGIGKTRTAEEVATYARLRGAQVLWGRCYEGEGTPAFWPWVQLIRSYIHNRDPQALLSEMGPGAAAIAQVVSELREQLPDLPAPPPLEPDQARFRLFDSTTTFLRNASRAQPLVLILDDLHWADKPSLLLLQFLARQLRGARLLVVGSYRDVEVGPGHPLAQVLRELGREQLSGRVVLGGLSEQDVARFIEITAGRPPPAGLVAAVYRETEGNPFFITEVVRLLVSEGWLERPAAAKSWSLTIPQSVRDVVARRLDHLSADANTLLAVAAVVGREFRLDVIEQVALDGRPGLTGERVLEALEEAAAARVLDEVPGTVGGYRFSHALIRESLYAGLGAVRRARLHGRIGETLEGLYAANAEPHLAELAYHFAEAAAGGAHVDEAIAYAVRAGERAARLLAHEEAVRYYQMARQALERQRRDEQRHGELLLALGQAQARAGEWVGAKETFQEAAALARRLRAQTGAPQAAALLAGAALGFAAGGQAGVVDEQRISLLEEALNALGEHDSALRAGVLGRLAGALYYSASLERRAALTREAVAVARRLGDARVLAAALNARRFALWGPENVEERLAAAGEIVALAEAAGDRERALQGYRWRIVDLMQLGDIPAADAAIARHTRLAEDLRQPLYLWRSAMWQAMRTLMAGRFDDGERLAQQALAIGQRAQDPNAFPFYAVHMFVLRADQGRLGEQEAILEDFVSRYPALPAWRCALAYTYAELDRPDAARREFEHLAATDFTGLPRDANWLVGVAFLSQVCASLADVPRAATLYGLLRPYAGHNVTVGDAVAWYGAVAHFLGLLAAAMGRWQEAARHFADTLAAHTRVGARPWLARTQHAYATMLAARGAPGDREQALDLATRALATARDLHMARLVDQVLDLQAKLAGVSAS